MTSSRRITSSASAGASCATPLRLAGSCCARRSTRTAPSAATRRAPRSRMTTYILDGADPRTRPVVFAFNGGPGQLERLASPGSPGTAPGGHGRRRPPRAAALWPGGQSRVPAHGRGPRLHRPDVDRLVAGRRGRQARRLPRLPARHRARRRADPALDVPQQALDVAEVRRGGVLRHASRRGPRRPPAGPLRHVSQRAHPHQQRSRPVVDRLREAAQRPCARALPADVRRRSRTTTASTGGAPCARSSRRPRRMPLATFRGCCPEVPG